MRCCTLSVGIAVTIVGTILVPVIALLILPGSAWAQPAGDDWFKPEVDPEALKEALGEQHVTDQWIYHDLDAAREQARETGKPILALFRCVPCGSAPGLDGAVCTIGGVQASEFEAKVREAGGELEDLLHEFVLVRMVKFNGVNRNQFRFDRDQPYAVMFLNADGTVYGRYGTRTEQDRKTLPRHNLSSFQQSLRRALEFHRNLPQYRETLAAKHGPDSGPPMAEDMETFKSFPTMKDRPPAMSNCIHCHTVGEAEMRQTIEAGKITPRTLNPFPLPENIGLNIDILDGLKVDSVDQGSLAQQAGIRSGDVLLEMGGQPLVSEADIQWVLHHAPDAGKLPVVLVRGDAKVDTTIALQGEWWKGDGSWRATLGPLRPGLNVKPDPDRVKKGVKPGQMGLLVNWPFGPAREAGIERFDLIVAVDGRTDFLQESDFLEYLYLDRPDLKSVEVTYLRDGKRSTVTMEIPREEI